jgi:hypothetical protein
VDVLRKEDEYWYISIGPQTGGGIMPYAKRRRWIEAVTGTDTIRKAATEIGVSHVTVSRWIRSGLPAGMLVRLVVQLECDPMEAFVVWGFLNEEDIPKLNYTALVRYFPGDVLTEEVHRRTVEHLNNGDVGLQKKTVGMLRRA